MTENTSVRTISEVQEIVHKYASYSQSKNGLGTVLGGCAGIIVYLINVLPGRNGFTVLLTLALTAGWFLGKEIIRRKLYRPFGTAQETWPPERRRSHLIFVAVVTLLMLGGWIFLLQKVSFSSLHQDAILLTLPFLVIGPWIMWRYLRTSNEFIIGVFLLVVCMTTCVGASLHPTSVEVWLGTLLFPLVGLGMIGQGIREHLEFRRLAVRLDV